MTQFSSCFALIMAGGEGVRFAPLSSPEKPKQFLNLLNPNKTLLQETYERLAQNFLPQQILVATNRRYISLVKKQLPKIREENIIGETEKKNTCPCLAWVSREIANRNKEAILIALPSDHFITPASRFNDTLKKAGDLAKRHKTVVTIGIEPTHPSTEYGYMEKEGDAVIRFVEKPKEEKAKEYLKSGRFYWNSGIFVFPVQRMLDNIDIYLPEMFGLLKTSETIADFFAKVPALSIDYGIMEKLKDTLVVEADFTWSDVGTWKNLKKLSEQFHLPLSKEVRQYLKLG